MVLMPFSRVKFSVPPICSALDVGDVQGFGIATHATSAHVYLLRAARWATAGQNDAAMVAGAKCFSSFC
jgi:hypothetical protein